MIPNEISLSEYSVLRRCQVCVKHCMLPVTGILWYFGNKWSGIVEMRRCRVIMCDLSAFQSWIKCQVTSSLRETGPGHSLDLAEREPMDTPGMVCMSLRHPLISTQVFLPHEEPQGPDGQYLFPVLLGWTWPYLSHGMEWDSVSFGDRKASVTLHLMWLGAQTLMWVGDVALWIECLECTKIWPLDWCHKKQVW